MNSNGSEHESDKLANTHAPEIHRMPRSIDPDAEEAYWRVNFARRPYVSHGASFIEYRQAYRYGVDAHRRFEGRSFDEAAPELMQGWDRVKGTSSLTWEDAQLAARDAWQRVQDCAGRAAPGSTTPDGK